MPCVSMRIIWPEAKCFRIRSVSRGRITWRRMMRRIWNWRCEPARDSGRWMEVCGAPPKAWVWRFSRSVCDMNVIFCIAILVAGNAFGGEQRQFGEAWSRNMVSKERGLPAVFDLETGRNVKWVAELGTESYSTPVVAGGRVFIGTNNERPRDPRQLGDRGVFMCL